MYALSDNEAMFNKDIDHFYSGKQKKWDFQYFKLVYIAIDYVIVDDEMKKIHMY